MHLISHGVYNHLYLDRRRLPFFHLIVFVIDALNHHKHIDDILFSFFRCPYLFVFIYSLGGPSSCMIKGTYIAKLPFLQQLYGNRTGGERKIILYLCNSEHDAVLHVTYIYTKN